MITPISRQRRFQSHPIRSAVDNLGVQHSLAMHIYYDIAVYTSLILIISYAYPLCDRYSFTLYTSEW